MDELARKVRAFTDRELAQNARDRVRYPSLAEYLRGERAALRRLCIAMEAYAAVPDDERLVNEGVRSPGLSQGRMLGDVMREQAALTQLRDYDPATDTGMDPDHPVIVCDTHTARDIDPASGRCWECGQSVALQAVRP